MKKMLIATLLLLAIATLDGCAHNYKRDIPRGAKAVRVPMEVTGYSDDKKSTNWKRNWLFQPVIASGPSKGKPKKVGITASGKKAKHGTIAADTSHYPMGTIMHVPGYGYGQVQDRGGAIKGQKIDLFFETKKEAFKWGRRKNVPVTVWVVR